MVEKTDYVGALSRQLDQWSRELDILETGARDVKQTPKVRELLMLIAELRQQQAEMRARAEALQRVSEAGSADLRAATDEAVESFKVVYSKARLLWPPD
jgi:hypothetical protein